MECKVCGNNENNRSYKVREMMFGLRDYFTYFQCDNCKCLQIAQIPDNLSTYYPDNYYSYRQHENPSGFIRFVKRKRNEYAVFNRSLMGKLLYKKYEKPELRSLSYLKMTKNMRILDVGCGGGEMLHSLDNLGFKNLTGIDPFNRENTLKIGNNVKIYKKVFTN